MTDLTSTWINRTGLTVTFVDGGGEVLTTIEPTTAGATLPQSEVTSMLLLVNGQEIPAVDQIIGTVHDLPEPVSGIGVIVTRDVATAIGPMRDDLWTPHELVADHGQAGIICRGLIRRRQG